MEPVIRLENVEKIFSGTEEEVNALRGVSLDIMKEDIFGIIGLSGAGKSTLVRCLNLLERPTAGKVFVNGQDLMGLSEMELRKCRQKIGMIFQHFNLLMQRTVLSNVCFPLEIVGINKKEARKRAMEMLELVGIADKAKSYPSQLSGGQKQRVAIARVLANQPEIILCDEATSALDPMTTKSILQLLKDINRSQHITIVVITHEMKVVQQICNRMAVLDRGKVREAGRVEEIFAHPKTEAAKRLLMPHIESLEGGQTVTVQLPEDTEAARAFMEYLQENNLKTWEVTNAE